MRSHIVRFAKFGVVGASGLVVNVVVFEIARGALGQRWGEAETVFVANTMGIIVSIFTNFVLNDCWTWADRVKGAGRAWFRRLGKYYVSGALAAGVQLAVTQVALWAYFRELEMVLMGRRIGPTLALLCGIGCGMGINFLASHLWAFKDA